MKEEARKLLEASATAIATHDFEAYAAIVRLPFLLIFDERSIVRRTRAELRRGFDSLCGALDRHGFLWVDRQIDSLQPAGKALAAVTFTSRIRCLDGRRLAPFASMFILGHDGERWRAVASVNPFGVLDWTPAEEWDLTTEGARALATSEKT
ncbi:MAG TPA: hypothetical protein VFR34_14005 [Paracoccaceae bacterium]|nr:hypothetical protein [Paracoccaceae bacterium]